MGEEPSQDRPGAPPNSMSHRRLWRASVVGLGHARRPDRSNTQPPRITTVRRNVARCAGRCDTSRVPTMAVKAANSAEPTAQSGGSHGVSSACLSPAGSSGTLGLVGHDDRLLHPAPSGEVQRPSVRRSSQPGEPNHRSAPPGRSAGNVRVTRNPGAWSCSSRAAPCNSAMAATRLSPRPLPGVDRLPSTR